MVYDDEFICQRLAFMKPGDEKPAKGGDKPYADKIGQGKETGKQVCLWTPFMDNPTIVVIIVCCFV